MKFFIVLLLAVSAHGQAKIAGAAKLGGASRLGAELINSTPPMGWNSWYWNAQNAPFPSGAWQPTEAYIKQQADALVSSGLAALGYKYVGVDAGWQQRTGGVLVGIPAQFPSGMPALATYVHGDGLLFGLYGTGSTNCAAGYPTEPGFEVVDAATIASWGADFWKYDGCGLSGTDAQVQAYYQTFGTALQRTGRNISYLVNQYSQFSSVQWYGIVGATTVRIGNDNDYTAWWVKAQTATWTAYSASQNKGHWLDPDYLMGGLKENQSVATTVVGDVEARSQFNWYAIIAAPLVIANRIDMLDTANLATYSNAEVIAVDQDSLGIMGARTSSITCGSTVCEVWVRQLATGYAIAMINYDPSASHTVTVAWSDFGQSGTWNIRDLWLHASVGSSSSGYSVNLPAWGSTLLRITQ